MEKLSESYPGVYIQFQKGNFTVRQTEGRFNGAWSDLALEQTYDKEGKTSLFIKSISKNMRAQTKYIRAMPVLSKVSSAMKEMVHMGSSHGGHHGESTRQTKGDVTLVERTKKVIEGKMINPFKTTNQTDLLNISTGAKAISTELIYVREKGIVALKTAEESGLNRIIPPSISRFKDKKFSKHNKQQSVTQIYKDELAVTRALCFFQQAGESLRDEAFSHEWPDYPSSLFKPDARFEMGISMVKGHKSGFLAGLSAEIEINMPENLPGSSLPTSYLIDAMFFIQRYQHLGARTFQNLVECYLMQLLRNIPPRCRVTHRMWSYESESYIAI